MAKYQLVYFGARARGEPIRLAFAVAGVEFEDKRIKFEDWPKEKPNAPQGRIPYLVKPDGKKVSQSLAILRYLGREYNLCGKDNLEKLYMDEVIDTCADLLSEWEKAAFGEEAKKAELKKKFKDEQVPKFYVMLENCVKEHGGKNGFAVGDKLSIADLMLYNTVETAGTDCLGEYKGLKANREKVGADAKIAKWVKDRPKTDF